MWGRVCLTALTLLLPDANCVCCHCRSFVAVWFFPSGRDHSRAVDAAIGSPWHGAHSRAVYASASPQSCRFYRAGAFERRWAGWDPLRKQKAETSHHENFQCQEGFEGQKMFKFSPADVRSLGCRRAIFGGASLSVCVVFVRCLASCSMPCSACHTHAMILYMSCSCFFLFAVCCSLLPAACVCSGCGALA